MVFKSKKDILEPLKKAKDDPGPGEYIPQTQTKKIKTNYEPFLSTINGTFYRVNNVPGPGSYYQDELLIKYLKNIQNQKISDNNEKKSLSQTKNNDAKNDKKIVEKLGFNSKSKRFSDDIFIKSHGPGPCYYFPKINKFFKNKTNKIKEEEFNSKERQKNKIKNVYNLIPTIPAKHQKFGFDISKDGKILPKKDPNIYKIFTGEKGDSVGPGTYEVKQNELYKTRPQWTMSKEIRNCYITNAENMSKIELQSLISTNHSDHSYSSIFNNSNLLSSITANNFYIDDKLNVFELSPYNISNYNISNYESQSHINNSNIKINIGSTRTKLNRISKPITNKTYNNEKYKKISSRQLFERKDNTPGPGFYIDQFKRSAFKIKTVPEYNQFFGSAMPRFKNFNNSYDNCYYEDNTNDINKNPNNIRSKSLFNFAPFSSKEERFKVTSNFLEKCSNPSPCEYNPKLKKAKSFSNNNKFNTCEKRFIESNDKKKKNDTPGPGFYNPDKIRNHINTRKYVDDTYKNNSQVYNIITPINYNINSIEYLNNKKVKSTNLKNVTFFKCNPKFSKSVSCQRLGPGSYYHEKKYEYKQIMPPFNRASEKNINLEKKPEIKTGPGKYNHESYFDWNKKSFNISYL